MVNSPGFLYVSELDTLFILSTTLFLCRHQAAPCAGRGGAHGPQRRLALDEGIEGRGRVRVAVLLGRVAELLLEDLEHRPGVGDAGLLRPADPRRAHVLRRRD